MTYSKFLSALSISVLTLSLTTLGHACGPSTQMTKARVNKLINWSNQNADLQKNLTKADIDAYYAPSFQKIINGKLIATNAESLIARRNYAAKQYRSFVMKGMIQDEIIDDNKAAVRFDVAATDLNGKTSVINETAFITFNKDGKVSELREIFDQGNPIK